MLQQIKPDNLKQSNYKWEARVSTINKPKLQKYLQRKKNPEKKLEVINFAKIEEDAQFASGFVLHLPAVVSQYLTQCVIARLKQL